MRRCSKKLYLTSSYSPARLILVRAGFPNPAISSVFVALLFIAWITGCGVTVKQKPFTAFSEMASKVTEIDGIINSHYISTKEREFAVISRDKTKIRDLSLTFSNQDPFFHDFKFSKDNEPLFIKLERFKAGLSELNSNFIHYAQLLAQLAGGDLVKVQDFDTLAETLNTNVRNALKTLDEKVDPTNLAIFSSLAAESAKLYINTQRKQHLIDIIKKNHLSVKNILDYAREAVKTVAVDIRAEYEISNKHLLDELLKSTSADNSKIAAQINNKSIITGTTLDVLKAIDETYRVLEETHKELETALRTDQFSVGELAANIQRLGKLYDKMRKANKEAQQQK